MAELLPQKFELVSTERLKPHPRNPRRGNVEAIRALIRANRFYGAVLAQAGTGVILAGNHRLEAARAEGLKKVPVLWVEADDQQALKILLSDNRSNDLAGWDEKALAGVLRDLPSLDGSGWNDHDLAMLIEELDMAEMRELDAPEGAEPRVPRHGRQALKVALFITELDLFERAIRETGLSNRAEAVAEICRSYLAQAGQFNLPGESPAPAQPPGAH